MNDRTTLKLKARSLALPAVPVVIGILISVASNYFWKALDAQTFDRQSATLGALWLACAGILYLVRIHFLAATTSRRTDFVNLQIRHALRAVLTNANASIE